MKLTFRNQLPPQRLLHPYKHDSLRDGPVMRVMSRRLVTVATAVMVLVLAACTSSPTVSPTTTTVPPRPLHAVDLSATPTGWVPVAYGDAQISVPANFNVSYLVSQCVSLVPPGTVLVGSDSQSNCEPTTFRAKGTLVHFRVLTRNPKWWRHEKGIVVNGLVVYLGPGMDPYLAGYGQETEANDYVVPFLGIEVAAVGPLAQRVLRTLTPSPLAAVLTAGAAPTEPSSWRRVSFGGLKLPVPDTWRVRRTADLAACPPYPVVLFGGVILDTDQNYWPSVCPPTWSRPVRPSDGVRVDTWSGTRGFIESIEPGATCLRVNGLKVCPSGLVYSVLLLRVTVPGLSKPVFVSIGLAGNGIVARTILYSLRAA